MKALYLSEPVRQALGPCLRPGGPALSTRIFDFLALQPDARVLDAGCGMGASLALMHKAGFSRVAGIDLDAGLLGTAKVEGPVMQGDLVHLPIAARCVDLVTCECVWNLTDRAATLQEFSRILRPGGMVAVSDIYARAIQPAGTTWPVQCCFSKATDLETVQSFFLSAGFEILLLEDHTKMLRQTAAEFVFTHGSLHAFWEAVTGDATLATAACEASSAARPGLFLLIARRP